jgi:hypothetical protein
MPRVHPIVLGGLAAGACDILAAFAVSWPRVAPTRVLQYIASGVAGPAAFGGGVAAAGLGLALHFAIATAAAAVYFVASRAWPLLARRSIVCGLAYGIVVYLVMQLVVLPLSRVNVQRGSWSAIALMVGIHMVCVGLPIALATTHSRR